jgi:predicted RNA-binding Zn-ribbon protein involved in translation (DUF1610 family)
MSKSTPGYLFVDWHCPDCGEQNAFRYEPFEGERSVFHRAKCKNCDTCIDIRFPD